MFPEITSRLKGMLDGFGSKPVSLDLKAGGFSFDAVNVGWYARNGYPGIYSIMSGGMPAWSGEVVSLETALNQPGNSTAPFPNCPQRLSTATCST